MPFDLQLVLEGKLLKLNRFGQKIFLTSRNVWHCFA